MELLLLAQTAEHAATVGLLQSLLDGGVSMLLLAALSIVGWLYYKEKEAKVKDSDKYSAEAAELRTKFSEKVEELLRERLESEMENTKVIMRATEAMESVITVLERTNETLESITE